MKNNNGFSAIVPVAGMGTRLKPHTNTFPKVLLTVGHKPILGHILDQLIAVNTRRIYLVTGYMGDKIQDYVSSSYPRLDVTYVEQKEQRGLGHAVWLALKHVSGPVFILLGDTILDADLRKFVGSSRDCIGVREVADPRRFGVVEVKKGLVSALVEKPARPASNLAIVGAYSFRDSAALRGSLDRIIDSGKTTGGEIQLTDAIMDMVRHGDRIRPVRIDGWYDCGKASALLETNRHLLSRHARMLAVSRRGSLIIPPVYLAKSAVVEHSVIGPYVSIGDGAEIKSSIVSDSIINEKARISCAVLKDSLIGPNATMVGRRQQINIGENSELYSDTPAE